MCQLCSLEHKTKVYMDTKKFIILDCKDCCIPMAVWKEHTMSIREEYEEMVSHTMGQ